jgi:hypothetical protein
LPKKFAVKFDPPVLAIEYHLKSKETDYLLQIDLTESFKKMDDPDEICKWVFATYSDVMKRSVISEKQVLIIFICRY